ncbi:MAG: hypothetical protein NTU91_11745 [Chloroflexi bacterium]|nr:hypothetical protein [Chloroflexota bacterium]
MKGFLPLLAALVLGIAAGLYYAWGVNPVSYTDTSPASLREDFRSDYLTLIASAYDATGDLPRARARLALFAYADPAPVLSALAQQRLAQGWPEAEARALARLAADIQGETVATPATVGSSPTPAGTPTPTRTLTPIPSPAPTRTPTSTPGAPFRLLDREQVCDETLGRSLLQVVVVDAAGQPVPGSEVRVVWDTGQDHFFTGLKPDLGVGYGDFEMSPGVTYTVQLVDSDQPVTGLTPGECTAADGTQYAGSWLLRFQQPAR